MSESGAPDSPVLRRGRKGLVPAGAAAEAMFILFYSLPFWEWLFEQLFGLVDKEEMAVPCTLAEECGGEELLSNYPTHQAGKLQPYEARVFLKE